jgi:hypothetical protein
MTATDALADFAAALKALAKVATWNATPRSLAQVALAVRGSRPEDVSDLQSIIRKFVPDAKFRLDEGLDMSDLRTLLMLASKVGSNSSA